jgi:hypothetical protein
MAHQRVKEQKVDVSTREDCDGLVVGVDPTAQNGCDGGCTCWFDEILRPLQQKRNGFGDLTVVYRHEIIDVLLDEVEADPCGSRYRDSVSDRRPRRHFLRLARPPGFDVRGNGCCMDTDDAYGWIGGLDSERNA